MQLPSIAVDAVPVRAAAFVALALVCSWLPWGALLALSGDPMADAVSLALWLLGGLGPAIATVLLVWRSDGRAGLSRLKAGLSRWRFGRLGWLLLAPLAVGVCGVLVLAALDRVALDPAVLETLPLIPALLLSGVVLGGLEEIGWRGYLQPLLQVRYRPLIAALGVSAVWSLWHAPLFLLEGTTQAGASAASFALGAAGLSVLFAWVWNTSKGNLLLLVLLHAALNGWYGTAVEGLAPAAIDQGFGVVTAVLAAVLALGLVLRVGNQLGAPPVTGDRPR